MFMFMLIMIMLLIMFRRCMGVYFFDLLQLLGNKRQERPPRKHGNIPL